MGHSDVGVTLRIYSHVLPGRDEQAAQFFAISKSVKLKRRPIWILKILCAVTALAIRATVMCMGFYINDDYWAAIEDYPQKIQDEIIGALTLLYFTGEDQLEKLRSKSSKPVYLACRERVLVARKKVGFKTWDK